MSDIEPYNDRRQAQHISQQNIAALQLIVSEIAHQSTRLAEVEVRMAQIETKAAVDKEWMELRAFCLRYEVSPLIDLSDRTLSALGVHVKNWHERLGLYYVSASKDKKNAAFHERYGSVNKWRRDYLARYFRESGYSLDEELLADDGRV